MTLQFMVNTGKADSLSTPEFDEPVQRFETSKKKMYVLPSRIYHVNRLNGYEISSNESTENYSEIIINKCGSVVRRLKT